MPTFTANDSSSREEASQTWYRSALPCAASAIVGVALALQCSACGPTPGGPAATDEAVAVAGNTPDAPVARNTSETLMTGVTTPAAGARADAPVRPDSSASLPATAATTATNAPAVPDAGTNAAAMAEPSAEEDAGVAPATPCVDCCSDGYKRTSTSTELRRIAAFTPSPTDVTVCPDGNIYLTIDGPDEIWRITASDVPERFAAVSGVQPAGVACDEQGRLFVAAFALRAGSPYREVGVLMVTGKDAEPLSVAPPRQGLLATPNGVAFVPGSGIYVTDTLGGQIVRVQGTDGKLESSVVASNLLGVNGIAYDPDTRKLVVSNSLTQQVSSLLVAQDGSLGRPTVEWTSKETTPMLDGLAVDEQGRIYVANYQTGSVVRLPNEEVMARVTNPASLAFRGGELLVVDYHLNEPTLEGALYSVPAESCGVSLFGSTMR